MSARYQFGWMDDVTQLFEGNPIDIVSKYVNKDNIANIDIALFTSDVDYILLNPGNISKDGFVLLSASPSDEQQTLQYSLNYVYANTGASAGNMVAYNGTIAMPIVDIYNVYNLGLTQNSLGYYFYNCAVYNGDGDYLGSIFLNDDQKFSFDPKSVLTTYPSAKTIGVNIWAGVAHAALTPSDVSDLVVTQTLRSYKLPYVNFVSNSVDHILQNGWAAFIYLQQYYFYDMPAWVFTYNGNQLVAQGVKKLKTQTLKFPALTDPNPLQLIKTNLGNGTIQKMSVNLSSRNANTTLIYDTE